MEKRAEKERDRWFNEGRPMIVTKKTWREKRLAREERSGSSGTSDDPDVSEDGGQGIDTWCLNYLLNFAHRIVRLLNWH